jgi:protein-L-isoaspartate(D-aspartate) O-methyltransferase
MRRVGPIWSFALAVALGGILWSLVPSAADPQRAASKRLWDDVEYQILRLRGELGFDRLSAPVRSALERVPRHLFVPEAQRRHAYENRPLPIGYGQTISQPLIVAMMTEMLQVSPGDKVFELGTGSAYQAAVLDALDARVYSVEIIPELGQRARATLDELGHGRVQTRVGDGYFGWEEEAPFDAIIVTAASDHIPPPLIQQLRPGGRMVIPVGGRYATQQLVLVTRDAQGQVMTRELTPVNFVPLTGQR